MAKKTKADKFMAALEAGVASGHLRQSKRDATSITVCINRGRWPDFWTIFLAKVERADGAEHWAYAGSILCGVDLGNQAHMSIDAMCDVLEIKL